MLIHIDNPREETRKKFGSDPREYALGNASGFGCTTVTRILMKTAIDLPLIAPKWSGGFVNELFHTDFPTRRFYWSR